MEEIFFTLQNTCTIQKINLTIPKKIWLSRKICTSQKIWQNSGMWRCLSFQWNFFIHKILILAFQIYIVDCSKSFYLHTLLFFSTCCKLPEAPRFCSFTELWWPVLLVERNQCRIVCQKFCTGNHEPAASALPTFSHAGRSRTRTHCCGGGRWVCWPLKPLTLQIVMNCQRQNTVSMHSKLCTSFF